MTPLAMPSAVLLSLLLLWAAPAASEIYRWVDAHGTVHLDDDIARVPEEHRPTARVFRSKAPAPALVEGAAQGAFARAVARELGLVVGDLQDPVSVLQIVGIYPSTGWHPRAAVLPAVVDEVAGAARGAARGRRVHQSVAAAEAAVLRAAASLGIAAPPPTVAAEPAAPRGEPPSIVIAPQIVVEAPRAAVVVRHVRAAPRPLLAAHPAFYPAYPGIVFGGVPFAPVPPPATLGPIPDRIPPLANPAGRLEGPLIEPLRLQPFRRPLGF